MSTKMFEYAEKLQRVLDETPGLTLSEVARVAGMSEQRLFDYLLMNKADPRVKAAFLAGEITQMACVRAGALPVERQIAYIERKLGRRIRQPGSGFQLSLFVRNTVEGTEGYLELTELIGDPMSVRLECEDKASMLDVLLLEQGVIGSTMTWELDDAAQLVRSIGYAKKLGLVQLEG